MKHDLDDVRYTKRQRVELFFQLSYCAISCVLLIWVIGMAIREDCSLVIMIGGATMSFITGAMSLLYGLSRRHRTDHKQLHDMLVNLGENNKNDAEQANTADREGAAADL